jgi:hypothetical protein
MGERLSPEIRRLLEERRLIRSPVRRGMIQKSYREPDRPREGQQVVEG